MIAVRADRSRALTVWSRALLSGQMPRDDVSSTVVIAISVTIGALALLTPLALRLILAPPPADVTPRPQPATRQQRLSLEAQRLAFQGNCGIGEFKDRRRIEDSIRSSLRTRGLHEIQVQVSDLCVAALGGQVESQARFDAARRAASHPWVRRVLTKELRIVEPPR